MARTGGMPNGTLSGKRSGIPSSVKLSEIKCEAKPIIILTKIIFGSIKLALKIRGSIHSKNLKIIKKPKSEWVMVLCL